MDQEHLIVSAARIVELAGVSVLIFGALVAAAAFVKRVAGHVTFHDAYHGLRADLGRAILLGLELEVSGRWPWQREDVPRPVHGP